MDIISIREALPKNWEKIVFWVVKDPDDEDSPTEAHFGVFMEGEDDDYFVSFLDRGFFPGEMAFCVNDKKVLFWSSIPDINGIIKEEVA